MSAGTVALGAAARITRADKTWVDRKYTVKVVQRVTYAAKTRQDPSDEV